MVDEITKLPVKFKKPPGNEESMLKIVSSKLDECNHSYYFDDTRGFSMRQRDVQYLIREGETEVECGHCGAKLDPMFVLRKLAHKETEWHETAKRYQEEMKRLAERSRTRCESCGKMTKISRS